MAVISIEDVPSEVDENTGVGKSRDLEEDKNIEDTFGKTRLEKWKQSLHSFLEKIKLPEIILGILERGQKKSKKDE